MELALRVDRVNGVMKAKGLKRKALIDAGIKATQVREWLQRRARRVPPSGVGIVTIALILEVSAEWLMGGPSRYDHLEEDHRRVAIESSLNFFLEQTTEGRLVTPDLVPRLRDEVNSSDPPTSADRWKARADTILRAARWGETRNRPLDQMMSAEGASAEEAPSQPETQD